MLEFEGRAVPGRFVESEAIECVVCHGTGNVVEHDGLRAVECVCVYRRRKREFLGEEIFDAAKIQESPLIERTRDRRGLVADLTCQNLWVTAEWAELLPHLRFALGIKWHLSHESGEEFRFRLLTDEQLRLGYLEARTADGEENLPALLSGRFNLVVLRLGFLGWKNSAMPGILLSALMHRREIAKAPLWIVDTPTEQFSKGHLSWSEDAVAYVTKYFRRGRVTKETADAQ